jgi:hypothetical protein
MTEPKPPRVVITLGLEERPRVRIFCRDGEEEKRIRNWIETNPQLADIVYRAVELAEERAA